MTIVRIDHVDYLKEKKAHSKFPASGFERLSECSGSVALSEGVPDVDTEWSIQGTIAHGVLERILLAALEARLSAVDRVDAPFSSTMPRSMVEYGREAANFILRKWREHKGSELKVESRVYLSFIHPEAFGTLDSAIVDHFGTLHVFDYKFGAGYGVSPKENLQMIFYALALAYLHHWNFKRVRLWIIQPRIKGYDGPLFWEISIDELRAYVPFFEESIENVLKYPDRYKEGSWCHFCKGKKKCPLKNEKRQDRAVDIFKAAGKVVISGEDEEIEEVQKELERPASEADWRKAQARAKKEKARLRKASADFY